MLPIVSEEFELACIFLLFSSFHYHCQLVKGQLQQKSGGLQPPPLPQAPGFYEPVFLFIQEESLGDLLEKSCSKSMLNKLKYPWESILFLLKLQAISLQFY